MSEDRRRLLKRAFDNQENHRVLMGFWHHFILGKEQFQGLENPEILQRAIDGHLQYFRTVNPDMMKLMNEGFMGYPPVMESRLETGEDLRNIKCIGADHPWITRQVEHVKKLVDLFGDKVMTFYNVFAPVQVIRIRLEFYDMDFRRFVYLAEHFPKELSHAAGEIQKDLEILVKRLFTETRLDGIYYCVQNIQSRIYNKTVYDALIKPTELPLLKLANRYSDYNILHICGYAHHKNNLEFYSDYESKAYNWATFTEGLSLSEGKRFFKGKCVLGGFDNNPDTLIDTGSKQEIEQFVHRLVKENGYRGFVLGADCSIPNAIDDKRIHWISKCVRDRSNQKKESDDGNEFAAGK